MDKRGRSSTRPVLSVVIPVFNEERVLGELHSRLRSSLAEVGGYELIYVDDGSTDGSAGRIEEWARTESGVVLAQLSRNFGMEVAMAAGLDLAHGRYVALVHADLQDPPELIPDMLRIADDEGADVVYGRRIGSDESALKRTLATAFYGVMGRLAGVPYQGQAGDFRLISERVADVLRRMPERQRFLRGMVAWVGFKQVPIEYRRAVRHTGRGASYPQLFRLAIEALTAFSDVPLALASYVGLFIALVSATIAIALVVMAALGVVTTAASVWAVIAVLLLGGVELITIGIVGRYLARVHGESLGRPLYVTSRVVTNGDGIGDEPVTPEPGSSP